MTSYCRAPLTFAAHQKPTVGDSKFSAAGVDHMGWLLCDGRTLSKTSYAFLYNVIGDSFNVPGTPGTMFRLPNPSGRVPGVKGTGVDQNLSTMTFSTGQVLGEYVHQLTIAEMPSHNHGVATSVPSTIQQSSYNNSTSMEFTGVLVEYSTTQITANQDPHSHTYTTTNSLNQNVRSVKSEIVADDISVNAGTAGATTGTADPPISVDNPPHKHPIFDPRHSHSLNPAGQDNDHNTVQPTLVMGNMFIYCGLYNAGAFPYTTGSNLW
jgi:microcystin-dependent protein